MGSRGRKDASCRFRAGLAWLPSLLLSHHAPCPSEGGAKEGSCTVKGRAEGLAAERREQTVSEATDVESS